MDTTRPRDAHCEFCKIVAGAEEAEVVYEDAEVLAFLPLEAAGLGHTLVIPKQHVPFLWQLDDELASSVFATVIKVATALNEVLQPDGMNMISSSGEAATQTIFHLHMHLLPRWADDHIGNIWQPAAHGSEAVDERTAQSIRDYFANTENKA